MSLETGLLALLPARDGHFRLESGLHAQRWLDLDTLFLRPRQLEAAIAELAQRLRGYQPDFVIGPLSGGALIAQRIASLLDLGFAATQPRRRAAQGLFPVAYDLPAGVLPLLRGRRIAVVDDVINAGSALYGTLESLRNAGAEPVAAAALLVLGDSVPARLDAEKLPLERIAALPNPLWLPEACPLCARGVPLEAV